MEETVQKKTGASWQYEGYEPFSNWSSDQDFANFRRFRYLHARVMLDHQDKLYRLENVLVESEKRSYHSKTLPIAPDSENSSNRSKIIVEIDAKMKHYDELLVRAETFYSLTKPRRYVHVGYPKLFENTSNSHSLEHEHFVTIGSGPVQTSLDPLSTRFGFGGIHLDKTGQWRNYTGQNPSGPYHDRRWHLKGRHRGRTFTGRRPVLYGMAAIVILPCVAATFNRDVLLSSARAISGVISVSSGVSLIPLQTEPDYTALRWGDRLLWASTYGVFLTCAYYGIEHKKYLYLFCSLALTAHFIGGFAAQAGTEGVLTFGPVTAAVCAALFYLVFRPRSDSPPADNIALQDMGIWPARNRGAAQGDCDRISSTQAQSRRIEETASGERAAVTIALGG